MGYQIMDRRAPNAWGKCHQVCVDTCFHSSSNITHRDWSYSLNELRMLLVTVPSITSNQLVHPSARITPVISSKLSSFSWCDCLQSKTSKKKIKYIECMNNLGFIIRSTFYSIFTRLMFHMLQFGKCICSPWWLLMRSQTEVVLEPDRVFRNNKFYDSFQSIAHSSSIYLRILKRNEEFYPQPNYVDVSRRPCFSHYYCVGNSNVWGGHVMTVKVRED